jgi:hypothetical protein
MPRINTSVHRNWTVRGSALCLSLGGAGTSNSDDNTYLPIALGSFSLSRPCPRLSLSSSRPSRCSFTRPSFMARREILTASSSRPQTSGDRPTTSGGYLSQDTGYTYSNDYSFDDDEESEEEDVFAFVPPSTADHHLDQSILQSSQRVIPSSPQSLHVTFPQPTNGARTSLDPSSSNIPVALALHHLNHRHSPQVPIDTPPSTDSQGTDDPYRLRRLVTATTSARDAPRHSGLSSPRTADHHQLHLPLPTPTKRFQDETRYNSAEKGPAPSILESSRSNFDDDSRPESIK